MVILRKLPYRPMIVILALFLLIFPFYYRWKYQVADRAIHCFYDGEQVTLDGILYKKEFKNNSYRLYLKNIYISNSSFPGRGILICESDDIPLGSKLHISMKIKTFSKAKNEGSFDEETYYLSQGIYLRGELRSLIDASSGWTSFFQEGLYVLREEMKTLYVATLPGEEAGILTSMTLGDKTTLDEEVKQLFSDAGLSHILAVSGLHISIVGMGLFHLLRKKGCSFLLSGIVSGVFVICYGYMTGLSVSTFRAVIMFLILMSAQILGKVYDMLSAWCVAVIVVLLVEPLSIYNSGFLFSFGAVLGIALVANPMVEIYEEACKARYKKTLRFRKGRGYKKDFKESVISSILFALGIQLFSLPLVAYFYYQVPLYVIGLNLLLIPLLSMVIGIGLVGGVIGSLAGIVMGTTAGSVPGIVMGTTVGSVSGGVMGTTAGSLMGCMNEYVLAIVKILLFPCHLILYLYEFASDLSLNLPVAQIVSGRPSIIRILLYYVILFFFVWRFKWWLKSRENGKRTDNIIIEQLQNIYDFMSKSIEMLSKSIGALLNPIEASSKLIEASSKPIEALLNPFEVSSKSIGLFRKNRELSSNIDGSLSKNRGLSSNIDGSLSKNRGLSSNIDGSLSKNRGLLNIVFSINTGLSSHNNGVSPRKYSLSCFFLGVLCFLILTLHPFKKCEMDMLWVGQGDGIFISSEEGVNFFIDGGSTSEKELGTYVLEPFLLYHGVKRVDYWFLSHMDSDHISGCLELLEGKFPISTVVVTDTLKEEEGDSYEHYQRLVELCNENNTEILYVKRGDIVATDSLQFLCLGPESPSSFSGANENSMILELSYGEFNALFTGDMGSEQEQWLLEQLDQSRIGINPSEIEVLKLAHHGAKSSNSMEWLERISPMLSIISAGENNPYGHPHKETIDRLKDNDIPYLCTIEYGEITILPQRDGSFEVKTMLE
ncbi:MAG: ComEC/Rec2 family competence protein [Lachnospiraceae bacterium]|nr:ComEC/Rec2 family competence protein [Lachnospiraceae bacterium]